MHVATKNTVGLHHYDRTKLSETTNGLVPLQTVINERQQIKNDINNNVNNWLNGIYGYARFVAKKTHDASIKENAAKIMAICSEFQVFNEAIGGGE